MIRSRTSLLCAVAMLLLGLSPQGLAEQETYRYTVTIKTGEPSGAGTDANIVMKLEGENGAVCTIDTVNERISGDAFESEDEDTFTTTPCPYLGWIQYVTLRNEGGAYAGNDWYVESVKTCRNNCDITYFHQWIEADEEVTKETSGQDDREAARRAEAEASRARRSGGPRNQRESTSVTYYTINRTDGDRNWNDKYTFARESTTAWVAGQHSEISTVIGGTGSWDAGPYQFELTVEQTVGASVTIEESETRHQGVTEELAVSQTVAPSSVGFMVFTLSVPRQYQVWDIRGKKFTQVKVNPDSITLANRYYAECKESNRLDQETWDDLRYQLEWTYDEETARFAYDACSDLNGLESGVDYEG